MDAKELKSRYKSSERYFQGLDLSNLDLSFFELSDADFSQSKLSHVNLRSANLVNTNFVNCDLTFADLSSTDLSNANLCGADLGGANLSNAVIQDILYNTETRFPIGVTIGENASQKWPGPQTSAKQATSTQSTPKTDDNNVSAEVSDKYLGESITKVYNDYPVSFEQYAIKVAEIPSHGDMAHDVILGESSDPIYWIVTSDDTYYWLLPQPDLRVIGTVLDTFQNLFDSQGLPSDHGFKLVHPARVEKMPDQTWKLLAKGNVLFVKPQKTPQNTGAPQTQNTGTSVTDHGTSAFPQHTSNELDPVAKFLLAHWVTLVSGLILALLGCYYYSIQQLNSLEVFWLLLVLMVCTIPSRIFYQGRPSFPNLITAIGVPFLGVINTFRYQSTFQNGWWLIFFIAFWLIMLGLKSREQNNPTFCENSKNSIQFINLNNLMATIGFFLNMIIVATYAPAYHYYTDYFIRQNKGLEVFGSIVGGIVFLAWSSYSFYYGSTIYNLAYNKHWTLKSLISFGLPVLGILSVFRHPSDFFASWWLSLGLGFVLVRLILDPAIRKSPKV
jgi:hypothetical protein